MYSSTRKKLISRPNRLCTEHILPVDWLISFAWTVRSSRNNSNNYGVLPETLKVGPVIEGRKTAEKTDEITDVGKESKIKPNSKETNL